jgi:hypothetical protein
MNACCAFVLVKIVLQRAVHATACMRCLAVAECKAEEDQALNLKNDFVVLGLHSRVAVDCLVFEFGTLHHFLHSIANQDGCHGDRPNGEMAARAKEAVDDDRHKGAVETPHWRHTSEEGVRQALRHHHEGNGNTGCHVQGQALRNLHAIAAVVGACLTRRFDDWQQRAWQLCSTRTWASTA